MATDRLPIRTDAVSPFLSDLVRLCLALRGHRIKVRAALCR